MIKLAIDLDRLPASELHPALDLRRRRSRDLAETVVHASRWATPEDRAIIRAVYAEGMTAGQVAALRGQCPRAVRRRVRSIVQRLLSPKFAFVLRNRDRWPAPRRRVATLCVLQGLSVRSAAKQLQLTNHAVRRQMDIVGAMFLAEQDIRVRSVSPASAGEAVGDSGEPARRHE